MIVAGPIVDIIEKNEIAFTAVSVKSYIWKLILRNRLEKYNMIDKADTVIATRLSTRSTMFIIAKEAIGVR